MTAISLGRKNKSTDGRRILDAVSLTGTRKTVTDTYIVQTTSSADNEDEVMVATSNIDSADDVPLLRSLGRNGYLREKSAREIDKFIWEVDCLFDSHIEANEPVVFVNWTAEEIQEAIVYDQVTGLPLVNAVGEPQFTTTPIQIQVLNIRRIENYPFNPDIMRLYGGTVNSETFYGAPAGTAMLKGPTTSPRAINGVTYEEVNYIIRFNFTVNPATLEPKGWQYHYLQHGTKYKSDASKTEPDKWFEVDGDRTTGNLNNDGTFRALNLAPLWISANRFRTSDLNDLNLGPF